VKDWSTSSLERIEVTLDRIDDHLESIAHSLVQFVGAMNQEKSQAWEPCGFDRRCPHCNGASVHRRGGGQDRDYRETTYYRCMMCDHEWSETK
jgi:DNA-directed RNA polymerase subunit M/transcription elongation factor TFIIS